MSGVTATAALMREEGAPLTLEQVQLAELEEGEVLVRMKGVGICHTDIAAAQGKVPLPLPVVLGHEGSGVVEAIGPGVTELAPGDHVVLSYDHCGECDVCTSRSPAYCELFAPLNYFGTRLDGTTTLKAGDEDVSGNFFGQSSFASYAIASVRNTVKVPDDLPIELLGPLGCGFQTGAGCVLNVLAPQPGESIGIWGIGGVGLAAVMAAKAAGCDPIIAVDINPQRLALAIELGATHTINPRETKDVLWRVQEIAAPGLHHALECVGSGAVVREALEATRIPGHCVSVGFQGLENEITIDQGNLMVGRRLTGVIEGDADPKAFVPRMIELYRRGEFPIEKLIRTFPFERVNDAIAASVSGAVIKPVLVFDD